jgi:hypothetical protein
MANHYEPNIAGWREALDASHVMNNRKGSRLNPYRSRQLQRPSPVLVETRLVGTRGGETYRTAFPGLQVIVGVAAAGNPSNTFGFPGLDAMLTAGKLSRV